MSFGLGAWTIIGASFSLLAIYKWITSVPSDTGDLGNLSSLPKQEDELPLAQTEDFWQFGYVPCRHGKTHYHLLGPETGPKLVLIHGVTATWAACPTFVDSLASNGFRVLAYDLYGRGWSSAPGAVYDERMYVEQLSDLLDGVGWSRAHVLGYSLGGAIAVAFAAKFPEKVHKLALIAPAGLMKKLPIGGRLFALPVIGKFLAHTIGKPLLVKISRKNHDPKLLDSPEMKQFTAVTDLTVLRHPGFMRAYLSTIKHGPVKCIDHHYKTVGALLGDRILCIWGTSDKVVNYGLHHKTLRTLMPKAHMITPNRGHSIVPESPKFCVEHVSLFLCSK
ncbi:Alpha/Beta hydrolase protein [Chytridium lagenaria]|nr:Alpha/Beta hydrolase protein [Chytridium lagenaria]